MRRHSNLRGWPTPLVCADHLLIFHITIKFLSTDRVICHGATLSLLKGKPCLLCCQTIQWSEADEQSSKKVDGGIFPGFFLPQKSCFSLKITNLCTKLLIAVLSILICSFTLLCACKVISQFLWHAMSPLEFIVCFDLRLNEIHYMYVLMFLSC